MKRKGFLLHGVVVSLLWAVSATAGTVTQINIQSGPGTESLGSYSGIIKYDTNNGATGLLDISLTNLSPAGNGGFITGLVFNIVGGSNATYQPIGGDTFFNLTNPSASPYGTFEEGAAIGGSFLGGGSPNSGIAVGNSRTFRFNVTGNVNGLSATDFFSQPSSNGVLFAVRFKGFKDGGSDKVPGQLIPTPATALAGLSLMGLLGMKRRRD
ncbi:MAG: hypothetical protein IT445_18865 [Phycisphaeraceae bacterium]|nr:hypothetical protein [Phycisphaeraceae bacterium]